MEYDSGHRLERLVFFSDAVFAIAITLLILDIHVPELPPDAGDAVWRAALWALYPHVLAFLLSFLVIGRLWISHHSLFALVGHYHPRLMWPSLLTLLGVAILPFAIALLSTGTHAALPFAIYCGCLLFASLMKAWLTMQALRTDSLSPHAKPQAVQAERRSAWLMPAAAALGLGIAFVAPGTNMLALALMGAGKRHAWFRSLD